MGNRAVITFGKDHNSPCIYLHWNGGRASVEGFMAAARALGIKLSSDKTETEIMDAIADVIARPFFGHDVGMTVYRETYGDADKDNWDNGVYLLNKDLSIGGRLFARNGEEVDAEKTEGIFEQIVARAPIYNH